MKGVSFMIKVKNLCHSYNKDKSYQVKDVSFEVKFLT